MNIPTLFFVEATLLLLFAITMLVDSIGQPDQVGNYWFAASNFCGATGLMIRPLFPHAPALLLYILPNLLLFLELSLLNKSIAEFVEHGRTLWFGFVVLSTVMAAAIGSIVYFHLNPSLIVDCISVITISTATCNAVLLFRYASLGIRIPVFSMAILFSFYAFNNILRTFTAVSMPHPRFYHIWLDRTILSGLSVCYLLMTNARLRHRLRRLANLDPLTGALNRRAFENEAGKLLENERRQGRCVSALMLDIDRFKHINDTYGHLAGDLALQALTQALRKTMRLGDLIVRLGGDEFLVILSGITEEQANEAADRLRNHLAALSIPTDQGTFTIQISIGVVSLDSEDFQFEDLIRLSDRKLYAAKSAIPNRATLPRPVSR